jgi:hypothetical protein
VIAQDELLGTLETWHTNSATDLDETPYSSDIVASDSVGFLMFDPTPTYTVFTGGWVNAPEVTGWLWMPWSFVGKATGARSTVPALGFGAVIVGASFTTGSMSAASSTSVLPTRRVIRMIDPAEFMGQSTPLAGETLDLLRLVTPGRRPHIFPLHGQVHGVLGIPERQIGTTPSIPIVDPLEPRSEEARLAVADLVNWLSRSRDDVARLCGFSLRASRYWDAGTIPRPSTVRHLFDVHSFLGSLVRSVGVGAARAWFNQADATGTPRLEQLKSPDRIGSLLRDANRTLFVGAPQRALAKPERHEAEVEEIFAEAHRPVERRVAPRRPRRPQPRNGRN